MVQFSHKWEKIWEKVLPSLIWDNIGSGERLRQLMGISEVVGAAFLLTPLQFFASLGLLVIMIGATYTHYVQDEPFLIPLVLAASLLYLIVDSRGKEGQTKRKSA